MSNEKQQHTPRPWNVETEDGLFHVTGTHNGKKTYLVELFDHRSIERENSEANAHLIAAAPDLLEACALQLKVIEGKNDYPAAYATQALRATLAKAKGE